MERFLKAVSKSDGGTFGHVLRFPDNEKLPLDDGEIGLEWREGQKIFTLSFSGDGHIVFAGILQQRRVKYAVYSPSHPLTCLAIVGMIASLFTPAMVIDSWFYSDQPSG